MHLLGRNCHIHLLSTSEQLDPSCLSNTQAPKPLFAILKLLLQADAWLIAELKVAPPWL